MGNLLSCDTSVVLGSLTADGSVLFAQNSDRPPNECQPLYHTPRRQHPDGATVRCQYLEIPQVAETWEVIGSRPYCHAHLILEFFFHAVALDHVDAEISVPFVVVFVSAKKI